MSLSVTSWILGLGGYAGLLTGLGLFALYGDMSLTYAALLPLCPLIGAGALYTFFHTVLLLIEYVVRVGYLMLDEQIVVVMISSVFLGLQACMIGVILYTQIREARAQREAPIPEQEAVEQEEVEEEEVEATEEEEEVEETETNVEDTVQDTDNDGSRFANANRERIASAEQSSVEDDMPGLIHLVAPVEPAVVPAVAQIEPAVAHVEPTVITDTVPFPIPSTMITPIASIYMDMVPSLGTKNTQSHDVEFAYLDKDLA